VARRRRRRGEGSVYRSQGSWIAAYPLGSVDGKRRTKRSRHPTEREALAELERLRRAYGYGANPASGTLGQYLDSWIAGHVRGIRKSTAVNYEANLRLHVIPLLGGIPLAKLHPSDVRRLIDDLERKGRSPGTIHKVVNVLRIALNAAVRERSLPESPARYVTLPRIESDPVRATTPLEADAILDAVEGHWTEHLVRLLLGSGIRMGEAIGLDQGDLMLDESYVRIRITKTRVRAVRISSDAVLAIRQALAKAPRRGQDEPVFFAPNKRRERMRGTSVSHALPRLLAAAGLPPLSPHKLRHATATLMLRDGVPMRVISEQLGHRNPAITARIYAHVSPDQLVEAVRSLERRTARSPHG
jgi:integrase